MTYIGSADGLTWPSNINMDALFHNDETFEEKLASIASFLASKNNIIALVGAGISVSCGIPDFRSENGLYNTLDYQVSQQLSSAILFYHFAADQIHEHPRILRN